jgi:hypothetical protein
MWSYCSISFDAERAVVTHYSGATNGPPQEDVLGKSWTAASDLLGFYSWELAASWYDARQSKVTLVFKHSRTPE